MPPKFEDMWIVVIEQGGIAEAALDAIDGMIDSMTDCGNFVVADWCLEGETAGEQWQIDCIFISLRGRFLKGLKCESVSRRRASLHPGMHVNKYLYYELFECSRDGSLTSRACATTLEIIAKPVVRTTPFSASDPSPDRHPVILDRAERS